MMIAPGAVERAMPTPKKVKASRMPRPGPGFASSRNRIDLPESSTCAAPSWSSTPWLMALFRKKTFAGSMMTLASGRSECWTRKSTAAPRPFAIALKIGASTKKPTIARMNPRMPAA